MWNLFLMGNESSVKGSERPCEIAKVKSKLIEKWAKSKSSVENSILKEVKVLTNTC